MCPILEVQNNKVGGSGENVTTKPYHSYIQECAQDFPKGGGTRMTLPPPPIMPRGGGEITPAPPTYVHTNAGNAAV